MQRNKQIRRGTYYRLLELDASRADDEARTVPAALSSDAAIERWFGTEVLEHTPAAVDLSRAGDNGLPLLYGHDRNDFIGRVRDVRLEGGKLRGMLHFSNSERADQIWRDVADGFLTDVSIGYTIREWREEKSTDDKPTRYVATRWQPFEGSIVSVAADVSVGVGRALHVTGELGLARVRDALVDQAEAAGLEADLEAGVIDAAATLAELARTAGALDLDFDGAVATAAGARLDSDQPTTEGTTMTTENTDQGGDVVQLRAAVSKGEAVGFQKGAEAERTRLAAIDRLFAMPTVQRSAIVDALREEAITGGWSVERTSVALLELRGDDAGPIGDRASTDGERGINHDRTPRVSAGVDALDKFAKGAELALQIRCGLYVDMDGKNLDGYRHALATARETGYLSMRLSRLAEESLRLCNVDTRGLSDDEIVGKAFGYRAAGMGHTTSDFTNVLQNVTGKAALVGWEEAPETWRGLARIGNLADFNQKTRPGLSNFSDLEQVGEDGEIGYGTMSDLKETITLGEYAKKFRITRRVIINDDLNMFGMTPRKMGRAASRKVGDIFWALITDNAALNQDSVALFHASHSNLAGSGAAPSVAQLNSAFSDMLTQTDPSGNAYVGGEPKFLAAPPALRGTVLTLLNSQKDPAEGTTTSRDADNIYYQTLMPVIEPRLQADSSTAWYLLKDPNMFDTFELGFLDGVMEPYLREQIEWDSRGVEFVVGIDVGGAVLDFRNVYKDAGT